MCGRYTLYSSEEAIRAAFHAEGGTPLGLTPQYNIAPSQRVPVVRQGGLSNELALARWGLVPAWSKTPEVKYATFNARLETVAEKPAFRQAFRHRRCLIPADGYYEWRLVNGKKTPHYVQLEDRALIGFAGLWEQWEGEGGALLSCSIIVMPAHEDMQALHPRMPVIVSPAHYDLWLDQRITDKHELMGYMQSALSSRLRYHEVSARVNSAAYNAEDCIYRVVRD